MPQGKVGIKLRANSGQQPSPAQPHNAFESDTTPQIFHQTVGPKVAPSPVQYNQFHVPTVYHPQVYPHQVLKSSVTYPSVHYNQPPAPREVVGPAHQNNVGRPDMPPEALQQNQVYGRDLSSSTIQLNSMLRLNMPSQSLPDLIRTDRTSIIQRYRPIKCTSRLLHRFRPIKGSD